MNLVYMFCRRVLKLGSHSNSERSVVETRAARLLFCIFLCSHGQTSTLLSQNINYPKKTKVLTDTEGQQNRSGRCKRPWRETEIIAKGASNGTSRFSTEETAISQQKLQNRVHVGSEDSHIRERTLAKPWRCVLATRA